MARGTGGVILEELTPKNDVAHSWDLLDLLKPLPDQGFDWCHANSFTVDEENDTVYVNCRFLGLFKARRSEPEPLWLLGNEQNGAHRGDVRYVPESSRFTDAHDPEIHDDGTVLLFDNGGLSSTLPSGEAAPLRSRVVEYRIDEDVLEARLLWEFPGDFAVDAWYREQWYAQIFGDANRLPNDNVLITSGRGQSATEGTRIFEVTRDGRIVWEAQMPTRTFSYLAQRVWPLPLVRKIK
jgi:hypothetical protein